MTDGLHEYMVARSPSPLRGAPSRREPVFSPNYLNWNIVKRARFLTVRVFYIVSLLISVCINAIRSVRDNPQDVPRSALQ